LAPKPDSTFACDFSGLRFYTRPRFGPITDSRMMKSRVLTLLVLALVATHVSVAHAARQPALLMNPFAKGHVTPTEISKGIETTLATDVNVDAITTPTKPFNAFKRMPGHDQRDKVLSPLPSTYVQKHQIPKQFTWSNVKGVNYLTKMLNQHVPQYCGSCWAHGSMSALADRIKIATGPEAKGPDVNLAIQFILNCGTEVAGSCHGGSATGAYQFVHDVGHVPFDTCLQYEACSAESSEGSCKHSDYTCHGINTCRTCSTFSEFGGFCSALDEFPNATIGEYGEVSGEHSIMAEVFARGPVAAGIDATLLDDYVGGIITQTPSYEINHIVSIVGWGETDGTIDPDTGEETEGTKYWIVRNSWGEYWGEMGFFRLIRGVKALGIEDECSWATPKTWTSLNVPCFEDGKNCAKKTVEKTFEDPSEVGVAVGEKMMA
tara:strand:- start:1342 stop:2643 length:1302 start_codon:yes stop_codon:yes gene_type:complete